MFDFRSSFRSWDRYWSRGSLGGYWSRGSPGGHWSRGSPGGHWSRGSPGGYWSRGSLGGYWSRDSLGGYWSRDSLGGHWSRGSLGGHWSRGSLGGYLACIVPAAGCQQGRYKDCHEYYRRRYLHCHIIDQKAAVSHYQICITSSSTRHIAG